MSMGLIDKETMIRTAQEIIGYEAGYKAWAILNAIREAPDAVVRCKNCTFREDPQSVISEWLPCQFGRTPDDWFCACGRKDPREECEA